MPIAIVTSGFKADTSSGVVSDWKTTPDKDATGATAIFAMQNLPVGSFVMNSTPANTFTQRTGAQENSAPMYLQTNFVNSNTPNVSNAFSVRSGDPTTGAQGAFYSDLVFVAFSGTAANPDGQRNFAFVAPGTSLGTGAVTPAGAGEAVISTITWETNPGTVTPPSGYTLIHDGSAYVNINRMAVAVKIKGGSDATAENPTWTWTTSAKALGQTDTVVPGVSSPNLSAPTKSDTATTVVGGFTTDGVDGTARMVWTRSATAPNVAQVKAGQDNTGSTAGVLVPSALTITSAGAKNFAAATPTTGLTYWGYVVHTNAAGGDSAVLSLGPVYPGTGRPVSDTLVTGFTVTGAATHSAALNEDTASDTEYVTSGALSTTPQKSRYALDKTYTPGTYPVKVRACVPGGTGTLRVRLTDSAGVQNGVSSDLALTGTMQLFTPNITIAANATHIEIEVTT